VLIAVAISAIVAAASYSGIATVLNGSEQLRAAGDRTRDLNRT
jgi:general secretion pathway protein J